MHELGRSAVLPIALDTLASGRSRECRADGKQRGGQLILSSESLMALNICIADEVHYTLKGRVWRASSSHNHNTDRPWGRRGSAVHTSVYGKVQAEPRTDTRRQ
jgi:hypothetical protein